MTPDLHGYAATMARYNLWMNDQLYRAAAGLGEARCKAPAKLFFSSIHGTFNHILLTDRMWLARFAGGTYQVAALDAELYSDFEELRTARRELDLEIMRWADALCGEEIPQSLHYRRLNGQPRTVPFSLAVIHFFNHQTHHRGQVSAALSAFGCDYGTTDLIFMPGASGD